MINKNNISLQITLSKTDFENLKKVNESLNKRFNFELSKSQVIQILINNFKTDSKPIQKESKKTTNKPITTAKQKQVKEPSFIESFKDNEEETKRKINQLKKRLNLSIPKMAESLNISVGNLKHYLYGQRTPTGKNADILREFYEKYDIK